MGASDCFSSLNMFLYICSRSAENAARKMTKQLLDNDVPSFDQR